MELDVLRDPQNVAERAQEMGLVLAGGPATLRPRDGKVLGEPARRPRRPTACGCWRRRRPSRRSSTRRPTISRSRATPDTTATAGDTGRASDGTRLGQVETTGDRNHGTER